MTAPDDLVEAARLAGVTDQRVLDAVGGLPRASFVPAEYVDQAYLDTPVPIPHGQVTTQPSLSARMLQALRLTGTERVLEIGTGYGYQTGLLARLAEHVTSIERWPDLTERARRNLAAHRIGNVRLVVGDGTAGVGDGAPYDAILVSAAFPTVPPPLAVQLRPAGRLVQPIGAGGQDEVTLFERTSRGLVARQRVVPARFVRLYGRHGYQPPPAGSGASPTSLSCLVGLLGLLCLPVNCRVLPTACIGRGPHRVWSPSTVPRRRFAVDCGG
jgi:protein-L-isoaspartate(D-aspartate) O-methyltransferase